MELYGTGSRRHDTGKQTIMELTSVGGDHVEIKYTSVIEVKITKDSRDGRRQEILRSPLDISETYTTPQIFKSQ